MTVTKRVETVEAAILLVTGLLEAHDGRMAKMEEQLEEQRRDNAMTRRLWVKLAAKYGWEDDDLFHEE